MVLIENMTENHKTYRDKKGRMINFRPNEKREVGEFVPTIGFKVLEKKPKIIKVKEDIGEIKNGI